MPYQPIREQYFLQPGDQSLAAFLKRANQHSGDIYPIACVKNALRCRVDKVQEIAPSNKGKLILLRSKASRIVIQ